MAFKETKLPDHATFPDKALGDRFPLSKLWNDQWGKYYAPKNFNFWYVFGSLALLVLVLQIVTGIFLVMHYKPAASLAFAAVEYIMREVPWGWLVRYMHSTGASAFFIIIYLHMTRALLYGSYRKPRELIWLFGFAAPKRSLPLLRCWRLSACCRRCWMPSSGAWRCSAHR